jgi:hypothetical protein
MLAEVQAIRTGEDIHMGNLNDYIGFHRQVVNDPRNGTHNLPLFYSIHSPDPRIRVFLHRDFESIARSCWKAQESWGNGPWWNLSEKEMREKWEALVKFGTTHAELVIDYNITKQDPKAVLKAIYTTMNCPVTESELERAVRAGTRENMLKEQKESKRIKWEIINGTRY